jgi:hypothetical protein
VHAGVSLAILVAAFLFAACFILHGTVFAMRGVLILDFSAWCADPWSPPGPRP